MIEPPESYKWVKRAHCLWGKQETRRKSVVGIHKDLKGHKLRGRARSTTKCDVVIICQDIALKLEYTYHEAICTYSYLHIFLSSWWLHKTEPINFSLYFFSFFSIKEFPTSTFPSNHIWCTYQSKSFPQTHFHQTQLRWPLHAEIVPWECLICSHKHAFTKPNLHISLILHKLNIIQCFLILAILYVSSNEWGPKHHIWKSKLIKNLLCFSNCLSFQLLFKIVWHFVALTLFSILTNKCIPRDYISNKNLLKHFLRFYKLSTFGIHTQ